jgi:hypothetical protein
VVSLQQFSPLGWPPFSKEGGITEEEEKETQDYLFFPLGWRQHFSKECGRHEEEQENQNYIG